MPEAPDLVVSADNAPGLGTVLIRSLALIASVLLVYWDGMTVEGWFIPPFYGYFGMVVFGVALLRALVRAAFRRPSLVANEHGVTVRSGLWLRLGPIEWDEVRAIQEVQPEESDVRRLSIMLKDPAATYQRLGQNWLGLSRWLMSFGDPLRLEEDDLDQPVSQLAGRLEAMRKAALAQ